jgi:hypothetical protein
MRTSKASAKAVAQAGLARTLPRTRQFLRWQSRCFLWRDHSLSRASRIWLSGWCRTSCGRCSTRGSARPQGGRRLQAGDRECLAAIIFVATSGCTWRQLPPVFGPAWPTVYRRFAQWSRDRVWTRLHRVILDELGARGELDWSRYAGGTGSPGPAGQVTGRQPIDSLPASGVPALSQRGREGGTRTCGAGDPPRPAPRRGSARPYRRWAYRGRWRCRLLIVTASRKSCQNPSSDVACR